MKAQVLVDWITFSVKGKDVREVISTFLGLDPALFVITGFSLNGYDRVYRFSDIFVMDCPRKNDFFQDMGVCVSMSGNGCRTFERFTCYSDAPFLSLFKLICSNDCNVSRLDIACDDRDQVLDLDLMVDKVRCNDVNSRMTKRSVLTSWDGLQRSGTTIYIGAESSDFRIRIYDKSAEQGIQGHWVRVELVMRGANSLSFVRHAAEGRSVGELAALVLNDKFCFIDRDDSNISRCSVCVWWSDFVGCVASLHLSSSTNISHPVEDVDRWVRDQVAPSLAMLYDALGWSHIFEMIMGGRDRLSDKQIALVDDFNRLFDRSDT